MDKREKRRQRWKLAQRNERQLDRQRQTEARRAAEEELAAQAEEAEQAEQAELIHHSSGAVDGNNGWDGQGLQLPRGDDVEDATTTLIHYSSDSSGTMDGNNGWDGQWLQPRHGDDVEQQLQVFYGYGQQMPDQWCCHETNFDQLVEAEVQVISANFRHHKSRRLQQQWLKWEDAWRRLHIQQHEQQPWCKKQGWEEHARWLLEEQMQDDDKAMSAAETPLAAKRRSASPSTPRSHDTYRCSVFNLPEVQSDRLVDLWILDSDVDLPRAFSWG